MDGTCDVFLVSRESKQTKEKRLIVQKEVNEQPSNTNNKNVVQMHAWAILHMGETVDGTCLNLIYIERSSQYRVFEHA